MPLGNDEEVMYEEHTHGPIRAGQVMVLATDGVWETVNETGEFFGMGRLRASIRAAADLPARDIAAAIRRDLDAFRGGREHRDDVTVVVIKVAQPPASPPAPSAEA